MRFSRLTRAGGPRMPRNGGPEEAVGESGGLRRQSERNGRKDRSEVRVW